MGMHLGFILAGMVMYAILPEKSRGIFTFIVFAIAASIYASLFWFWLVFLDGASWVQWFFGFAVIMSFVPAIGVYIAAVSIRQIPEKVNKKHSK